MLVETVRRLYDKKFDLNCAEVMIYAANEEYGLNLSKETLKVMGGFGGGMAVEGTCGAISGAVAVLGIMFVEESGHQSPWVREYTKEFMERFYKELGTYKCDELKANYKKDDEHRCIYMIETASIILEDIIKRERK